MCAREAQQVLTRAREHLYGDRERDPLLVIRLAETIITYCDQPEHLWEAFVVKVEAYEASGQTASAVETARVGVETVLTEQPERLTTSAFTYLKMLLVAYVERAVPLQGARKPTENLLIWQRELRERYIPTDPPDPVGVQAINELFAPLKAMVEQYQASGKPEQRIEATVLRYVQLFNQGQKNEFLKLFNGDSKLGKNVAQAGPAAIAGSNNMTIDLTSAILTVIESDTPRATAVCDLLALTSSGWAKEGRKVRFLLVRTQNGQWLIQDITGHPSDKD